jgi:hypothetical protein
MAPLVFEYAVCWHHDKNLKIDNFINKEKIRDDHPGLPDIAQLRQTTDFYPRTHRFSERVEKSYWASLA